MSTTAPAPVHAAAIAPLTVLVVDDDPVATAVVEGHLAVDGHDVHAATSVRDAVAWLEAGGRPDVILSDVMMPGDDGFVLCELVRAQPAWQHLPLVFLTAAGDREARIRALDAGADDLLAKPVDPLELAARVRSLSRLARARMVLAERQELAAVTGRIGDGVVVVDGAGRCTEVNDAAARLLGVRVGDWLPDVERRFRVEEGQVPGLAPPGPGRDREAVLHRPVVGTESPLWVRTIETGLGAGDRHVVVVRDVTDEKRAARVSDLVISAITHKVRTPLTGLSGAIELWQQMEIDERYEPVRALAGRSAARLQDVLLRILDFADELASGPDHLAVALTQQSTATTLAELVDDTDLAVAAAAARVNVSRPVLVRRTALVVVLEELLENARTHGGSAAVEVVLEADHLHVTVVDDGAGFPPADAERVFDRFFQPDTTGQQAGMGLGLALVRHVVEEVGGQVGASSGVTGTRFWARLPVEDI